MKGIENTGMWGVGAVGLTKPESGPKLPGHPNCPALPGHAADFSGPGPGLLVPGSGAGAGRGRSGSPHHPTSSAAWSPRPTSGFPTCSHPALQSALWPGTGLTQLGVTSPLCVRAPWELLT